MAYQATSFGRVLSYLCIVQLLLLVSMAAAQPHVDSKQKLSALLNELKSSAAIEQCAKARRLREFWSEKNGEQLFEAYVWAIERCTDRHAKDVLDEAESFLEWRTLWREKNGAKVALNREQAVNPLHPMEVSLARATLARLVRTRDLVYRCYGVLGELAKSDAQGVTTIIADQCESATEEEHSSLFDVFMRLAPDDKRAVTLGVKLLRSKNAEARELVVAHFGRLADKHFAIRHLIPIAIGDPSEDVRRSAIFRLFDSRNPAPLVAPFAHRLIRISENFDTRLDAAEWLAGHPKEMKAPKLVLRILTQAIESSGSEQAWHLLELIGKSRGKMERPKLSTLGRAPVQGQNDSRIASLVWLIFHPEDTVHYERELRSLLLDQSPAVVFLTIQCIRKNAHLLYLLRPQLVTLFTELLTPVDDAESSPDEAPPEESPNWDLSHYVLSLLMRTGGVGKNCVELFVSYHSDWGLAPQHHEAIRLMNAPAPCLLRQSIEAESNAKTDSPVHSMGRVTARAIQVSKHEARFVIVGRQANRDFWVEFELIKFSGQPWRCYVRCFESKSGSGVQDVPVSKGTFEMQEPKDISLPTRSGAFKIHCGLGVLSGQFEVAGMFPKKEK